MTSKKDNIDINMKGGEQDNMKPIKVEVTKYSENCPICNEEIVNNSPGAVKYNLRLHLEKHSKASASINEK